jgi:hypothetical protein
VPFFDQFRQNVARFAQGVHELGAVPAQGALAEATARLGGWPPGVETFYRSFDGARLFTDSFVLLPMSELGRTADGALRLGSALELELRVDARGRVHELDESGDALIIGSTLELWLGTLMAREKLVVDREGEFRDVFSDDGQELVADVRAKRARAGKKADPHAALFHFEEAELLLEEGDVAAAREALVRATELDESAPAPRAVLAGLLVEAGELEAAAAHYLAAASRSGTGEVRARRFAQAAELAQRRGDEGARHAAAQSALAAGGDAPAKWLAEAETAFSDGEYDTAAHLVGLSLAVTSSAPAEALRRKIAVRRSLRVVD